MSLFQALKSAGLLSQQQVEERQKEERDKLSIQRGQQFTLSKRSCKTQIVCANNPAEFRNAAKEKLLEEPDTINAVIREAHRFQSSKEGKKLVWELYQLRDALINTPNPENKKTVVERALRRIDRKFEPIN
jgi:hypothetical protein